MNLLENLPKRKRQRLENYDYSQNGAYFVTICVANGDPILSRLSVGTVALDCPQPKDVKIQLTQIGRIAEKYIKSIERSYEYVFVEKYVIMPEHIHMLIVIDVPYGASRAMHPTLSQIVSSFKRLVVKEYGQKIWQRGFYDKIIRTQKGFETAWYYIEFNPLNRIQNKQNKSKESKNENQ
ncbi:MAG TPA: transposase [Ruminococcaceae bacterium]|nr:transposase [Oscillospiraceae bacterium]